jgi:hypothetical protein
MTQEDQVLVADVVVVDPTWDMVVSSFITRPTCVTIELSTIIKICKYRGLHEGHHFIPMAMKVHDTPKHDMDHFIRECAHIFHHR